MNIVSNIKVEEQIIIKYFEEINSSIKINNHITHLTYDEFISKAYSDEGLDIDDGLAININDISEDVFKEILSSEVIFFRTNDIIPNFSLNMANVINWTKQKINVEVNASNVFKKNIKEITLEDNEIKKSISDLLIHSDDEEDAYNSIDEGNKEAKIYVFGSSKGGTGKTFTSIISTYRYAKTHPNERIALVDFDIIDGQVGISIHRVKPTLGKYYTEYQKNYRDFKTMKNFSIKANNIFPKNVDFYLAPSSGAIIPNDEFWMNVIQNCSENYDVVVFDTGIDYLNITPISYAYKIADKINLITTTSIKSVNSITKQIGRLKGEIKSPGKHSGHNVDNVFSKEDEISSRLNVVITQMIETNTMNKTIYDAISNKCNVIATFGVITDSVSQAEFYGRWDIFDKNKDINDSLDNIMT